MALGKSWKQAVNQSGKSADLIYQKQIYDLSYTREIVFFETHLQYSKFMQFFILCRVKPLKTPYGIPAEEDMADTYINSKGELIVRRLLQPVDPKAIES